MSSAEKRTLEADEIVRGFVEDVWNRGDLDRIENIVHPRYAVSGQVVGAEWGRRNVENDRPAFPNIHVAVTDIVVMENRVAARLILTGTHRAEYRGIAATGRTVTYEEAAFWTIEENKLREGWFVSDALGLRIQLGILPEDIWHNPAAIPPSSS